MVNFIETRCILMTISQEKMVDYYRSLNPNKNIEDLFKEGVRIGFYGSSFDPITHAHLWVAATVAHRKKLDFVVLLPSIGEARRDKVLQTQDKHREEMVKLAIVNKKKLILDTYEMNVRPERQYTYYTMEHFKKVFPKAELFFIMGADLLVDIKDGKWTMDEELIKHNQFIVMGRKGINMTETIAESPLLRNYDDGRFHLMDKGIVMEISSTYIREEIASGGEADSLLPDACYEYIKEHGLYKEIKR